MNRRVVQQQLLDNVTGLGKQRDQGEDTTTLRDRSRVREIIGLQDESFLQYINLILLKKKKRFN